MGRLILLIALLTATTAYAYTITRIGKSCQICIENGAIKVCKFHKKCPVKEDKDDK